MAQKFTTCVCYRLHGLVVFAFMVEHTPRQAINQETAYHVSPLQLWDHLLQQATCKSPFHFFLPHLHERLHDWHLKTPAKKFHHSRIVHWQILAQHKEICGEAKFACLSSTNKFQELLFQTIALFIRNNWGWWKPNRQIRHKKMQLKQ